MLTIRLFWSCAATFAVAAGCGADRDADGRREAVLRRSTDMQRVGERQLIPDSEVSDLEKSMSLNVLAGSSPSQLRTDAADGTLVKVALISDESPEYSEDSLSQVAFELARIWANYLGLEEDALRFGSRRSVGVATPLQFFTFARFIEGKPLRGAFLEFVFSQLDNGAFVLREISNSTWAGLPVRDEASAPTPVQPAMLSDLIEAANRQVVSETKGYRVVLNNSERAIVPTYEFKVRDSQDQAHFYYSFSAETGELLASWSDRYQASKVRIVGDVWRRSYLDQEKVVVPLPFINIDAGLLTVTTDASGSVDLEALPEQFSVNVSGLRANIEDTWPLFSHEIDGVDRQGTQIKIVGDDAENRAVNAYVAVNNINAFVRRHLAEDDWEFLGEDVRVITEAWGSCNAFFQGGFNLIALYPEGDGCANMADVNDVIYHEWGHALDNFVGREEGIPDAAFSEGVSDVLANYYNGESYMAPGFYLNRPEPLRDSSVQKSFPEDRGEAHAEGQIIAGAFWDLRRLMIERYGELGGAGRAEELFLKHLAVTDTYLESYQTLLLLNDDDNDPRTPTPDFCLITEAFARHGLADAAEDCVDNGPHASVDRSIQIQLLRKEESGYLLAVASDKIGQFALCLGAYHACTKEGAALSALTYEGSRDGIRFYVNSSAIPLAGGQRVTILAKNEDGVVTGWRELKFYLN